MLSQTKIRVFAFNRATAAPVTGDAANISATWAKDYSAPIALADANPSEIGSGYYYFDLTENERDVAIIGEIFPVSSTSGVQVMGDPGFLHAQTLIDSFSVTRIGPEFDPDTQTITLISGDDYLVGNASALTFNITVPGVDLTTSSAAFSAKGNNLPVLFGTATLVDVNTASPKLRLEWTRAQTKARKPGRYGWGVALVDEDGLVKSILKGILILKDEVVDDAVIDAILEAP